MRNVDGWEVDCEASLVSELQFVEEPVEEVFVAEAPLEFRDLLSRDAHFLRVLVFEGIAFPGEAEAALVEVDCRLAGLGFADEGFPVQTGPFFELGDVNRVRRGEFAPLKQILLFNISFTVAVFSSARNPQSVRCSRSSVG